MLTLRKILLCNYIYYTIFIITLIITSIRILLPNNSNYSTNSNTFIGVVNKIIIKEDKIIYYIKNKETIIGNKRLYNDENINLGDKVLIEGEFTIPSSNTTKYLFNYKEYLNRKDIHYLVNIRKIYILEKNHNIYYFLKQRLINNLNNNKYLNTFILGEKSYLSSEVKRSFQENGISHLFAISGMHISLLVNLIKLFLRRIKKNEVKLFIITSIILICYLLLVGFAPSILRGVLFYLLFTFNNIYYFYITPRNLFLFIISIALLINPNYIFDVGFLYSYTISFSLIMLSSYLKSNNYLISLLKVSLISFIVSIPISIYNFNQINILSIIYNLFYVPFVSYIIFPLSLIVVIITPLESVYSFLTNILENISLLLSNISYCKLLFKRLPLIVYIIYFIIILLFIFKPSKKYLIILFLLLSIHYFIPYFDKTNYIEYIDVGQGDSTLIHMDNRNILIDTGGIISYVNNTDGLIFYNTTLPLFRTNGIKKINYLILTHGDYDHMGEAINLVESFKVEKVIFNCGEFNDLEQALIKVLDKKKIPYYSCIKELNINNNKLYFLQTKEYDNENDNSNVTYTEIDGYKFMFMGDAGIEKEKDILEEYNISNIDVLKVGHHGSHTSSSKSFINEMNPKYGVISVGKNNRYGHPNKEILNNLNNSKIYRTDEDGSIIFKIKNNKLNIEICSP